jgi:hypothetical protein
MSTQEEHNAAFAAKYPGFVAAVKRSDEKENERMQLMETGSDEDIWAYEMCKEAAWMVEITGARLRWDIFWRGPWGQEFRQARALARAAEQTAGAGPRRFAA